MNGLHPLKNWLELNPDSEGRGRSGLLEAVQKSSDHLAWCSPNQNRKRKSIESTGYSSLSHSFPAEHLRPGTLYEISCETLPPVVPADVVLLRVVMLFDVKGMQAILKYPSVQSLKAFFGRNAEKISSLGTSRPKMQEAIMGTFPDLDQTFLLPTTIARAVLTRPIPCTELLHQGHLKNFWVADEDPKHRLSSSSCSIRQQHKAPEVERETGLLKLPIDLRARWSSERYQSCQLKLFQIMKDKGARPGKPIPRSVLREDARKHIGDTGLLDHLLKHMTDHVIADNQRFRRQHNCQGVIEYWIEDAGLMEIRKNAGIQDSAWVPPPGWKPGDAISLQSDCGMNAAEKVKMSELVQEVQCLRSDLELLSTKRQIHETEVPSESKTAEAELKKEMKNQVKSLKASIEELQAAYVQMQQGSNTSLPSVCEPRDLHTNGIHIQRAVERLEKLEQQVHRLAEGHIQLTNLWKAVMALQENMASLAAAIQPGQSSS